MEQDLYMVVADQRKEQSYVIDREISLYLWLLVSKVLTNRK